MEEGVADGVTSNPSIMSKDGVTDLRLGALRMCKLIGSRLLSVEVTTMIGQNNDYLVDGESGVLIAPGDARGLGQALER